MYYTNPCYAQWCCLAVDIDHKLFDEMSSLVCDPSNFFKVLSYITDSFFRLISLCRIGDTKCGDSWAHFMELATRLDLQESTKQCSTTLEESGQWSKEESRIEQKNTRFKRLFLWLKTSSKPDKIYSLTSLFFLKRFLSWDASKSFFCSIESRTLFDKKT